MYVCTVVLLYVYICTVVCVYIYMCVYIAYPADLDNMHYNA